MQEKNINLLILIYLMILSQFSIYKRARISYQLEVFPYSIIINCTMQCVCNQPITRLCNTPICNIPSQICDNKQCSVYQKHLLCSALLLDQYMAIDRDIEKVEKAFAERVNLVINELVEEIKYKENIRLKRRNFEKLGKLIKKLKKDKRNKCNVISGKEVCEMQEEVIQLREEDSKVFFERSLKEFTKKFEEIKQKIIEEKGKYFEKRTDEEHSSEERGRIAEVVNQLTSVEQGQINEPINPRDPIDPIEQARKRGKPEAEINEFLTIKDKIFLKESFPEKEIAGIKKIFTASAFENQYSPQAYYRKCGHLRNTLIVVKYLHKDQSPFDNNYFAAFTPLRHGYQYYQHRSYQDDPEFLSKIFWMNQKIVFPIKKENENKAIFINRDYGLSYGNDLLIKFKGHDNNIINIGNKYETSHLKQEQLDFLNNYQKKMRMEGKVNDYQVYQVEFRE